MRCAVYRARKESGEEVALKVAPSPLRRSGRASGAWRAATRKSWAMTSPRSDNQARSSPGDAARRAGHSWKAPSVSSLKVAGVG